MEVLIALVIFAVFIGAAGKLLLSHRALSDAAREHYTAINIAKNRVEQARTFGFDALDSFNETDRNVDQMGDPDAHGRYRRTTVVAHVTTNRLSEITVTVAIRNHRTHTFDGAEEIINSFIANPSP